MSDREAYREGGDRRPMFESGDQDYDSARDWNGVTTAEDMIREARGRNPRGCAPDPDMLLARPASEWIDIAIQGPPAPGLFGPFWQVEELAVLFGGTGTGKSALATQIAEALSRGVPLAPFDGPDVPRQEPQRVLYLDFELNLTQFAMRYAHIDGDSAAFGRHYTFSPNLIRTEMYWNGQVLEGYDGFSNMFFTALTNMVHEHRVTVVVVDNITFLDRTSTSNANTALNIMRSLRRLKEDKFVSILVLAHTPKRRPWVPLTELDLQGSIHLANFADSIFAVGRSRTSADMRYLKQVKVRSGRPEYTADNVPVFSLEKYDFAAAQGRGGEGVEARDFLGFRFVEFACEDDHLDTALRGLRENSRRPKHGPGVIRRARRLAAEGKSSVKIAKELGIPRSTVRRYVASA